MEIKSQINLFVGIGCDLNQRLPAEVLKFSILEKINNKLNIIFLNEHKEWENILKKDLTQRTPFSLQRFLCAESVVNSDADIGIYFDSDMIALQPLTKLVEEFSKTNKNIAVVSAKDEWRRREQSSVLIFNKNGANELWNSYKMFLKKKINYDELIYLKSINNIGRINPDWNSLEYLDSSTCLIHFTDMDTQPWLRNGNVNAGIWHTYLWKFIQNPENEKILLDEVSKKNVRPSLLSIIEYGPSMPVLLLSSRIRDINFVPKHRFNSLLGNFLRKFFPFLLKFFLEISFIKSNGNPNIR